MVNLKTKDGSVLQLSHLDIGDLYYREMQTVAARFRWLRTMRGVDPDAFAGELRIDPELLNTIERGERMAPDIVILQACRATGARLEWLSNGEGLPFLKAEPEQGSAVGNVAEALAREICTRELEGDSSLRVGRWNPRGLSPDAEVQEAEAILEGQLARLGSGPEVNEIAEQMGVLQGRVEFRGFEKGMRYGARLVFQMLTGTDSRALEEMIWDALRRLEGISGKDAAVQRGGTL